MCFFVLGGFPEIGFTSENSKAEYALTGAQVRSPNLQKA
jgi:hypothetical protein